MQEAHEKLRFLIEKGIIRKTKIDFSKHKRDFCGDELWIVEYKFNEKYPPAILILLNKNLLENLPTHLKSKSKVVCFAEKQTCQLVQK